MDAAHLKHLLQEFFLIDDPCPVCDSGYDFVYCTCKEKCARSQAAENELRIWMDSVD